MQFNNKSDHDFDGNASGSSLLTNAFNELRHRKTTEDIDDIRPSVDTNRSKDKIKTVCVGLVLCLNIGVDPPDIMKPNPCPVLHCWINPLIINPNKSLEAVGDCLHSQYQRLHPRAHFRLKLDPKPIDIKKLCTSMRRTAKEERILFHYNGQGVPKPTDRGEIWVFNDTYTQYVPLSVYDLQLWMGWPSVYVFDCSNAGIIVHSFIKFAKQHEMDYELNVSASCSGTSSPLPAPDYHNCILFASCAANELLPMKPALPADLFTSCLTTPIRTCLLWLTIRTERSIPLVSAINVRLLDKIPGDLADRGSMLGELNWIFTTITDTIAWNVFPRDLFERLFRRDQLVATLFRNFLLAERIMRTYDCTPISHPALPPTHQHPLWNAWDLALDQCLQQLNPILNSNVKYEPNEFFAEQLTAIEVWLQFNAHQDNYPEGLPVLLQALLSPLYRLRALDILRRYMDLGSGAVEQALSLGIIPYVLKLLESSSQELKPILVFIWAKVLAFDQSFQRDLVLVNGHQYFLKVMSDQYMLEEHRTMAAFVMSSIVKNYPPGQAAALRGHTLHGNLIYRCYEELQARNSHPLLRQWLAICLAHVWENNEMARGIATRSKAHEKLFDLLEDPVPEVRASAVYALGTFIASAVERTDQTNDLDHNIAITLINKVLADGSPIVRKQLLVAIDWFVLIFENCFLEIIRRKFKERVKELALNCQTWTTNTGLSAGALGMPFKSFNNSLKGLFTRRALSPPNTSKGADNCLKRANSSNCLFRQHQNKPIPAPKSNSRVIPNVYWTVWNAINSYCSDPYPEVALMAQTVVDKMESRVFPSLNTYNSLKDSTSLSVHNSLTDIPSRVSESSTSSYNTILSGNTSPVAERLTTSRNHFSDPTDSQNTTLYSPLSQYSIKRRIFGREPSLSDRISIKSDDQSSASRREPFISTTFVDWSAKQFRQTNGSTISTTDDPESDAHLEMEWTTARNRDIEEKASEELLNADTSHVSERVFRQKNVYSPQHLAFHPFENRLIVGEKKSFSVWSFESPLNQYHSYNKIPVLLGTHMNGNPISTRITDIKLLNTHNLTQLMTACNDGSVRVWRDFIHNTDGPELVTAFQVFSEIQNWSQSEVLLSWNQWNHQLIASGGTRVIRLWDARKEIKVRDLNTGVDSCVTTISTDGAHLICVGCGDGSVRVFDNRLMPHDSRVHTFYEHKGRVVSAQLYPYEDRFRIISGSNTGDIKWFDKRMASNAIKSISTSLRMPAMAVHSEAQVFVCALENPNLSANNSFINSYTLDGHYGCAIRTSGSISSLAFHSLQVRLATGTDDNFISIYRPLKKF